MAKNQTSWKTRGMNRDLSVSAFSPISPSSLLRIVMVSPILSPQVVSAQQKQDSSIPVIVIFLMNSLTILGGCQP